MDNSYSTTHHNVNPSLLTSSNDSSNYEERIEYLQNVIKKQDEKIKELEMFTTHKIECDGHRFRNGTGGECTCGLNNLLK